MAKYYHGTVVITVNGVDLSSSIKEVEVTQKKDDLNFDTFGSTSHVHSTGMTDGTIKIKSFQDFAAGAVDAVLSPIFAAGTPVPVVVRPTNAAVSATNPKWTMQGVLLDYSPIVGAIGKEAEIDVTFANGDNTGLVRATA